MLLGGCSALPSIPELQYIVPTGQQGTLATLVGSQVERGLFFSNRTTHVFAVDNKRVMSDEEGWSKALTIQPGMRNVTVSYGTEGSYIWGWGGARSLTKVDLQLQAVAGGSYQVQSSCEIPFLMVFGEGLYCDFWIKDIVTQKPVTGIVRWVIPYEYDIM